MENKLFAKILLIVFGAIFVTLFYKGIITMPNEGDSIDYHIPIAKSFLSGQIINPTNLSSPSHTRFYPANGEGILSLLLLLKLPLGIFNVIGILVLFLVSLRVAKSFRLKDHLSVIFAVAICTLNGVLRWSDTQIIDIWMLSFFLLTLSFLERPEKNTRYFVKLGICLGLLLGMKYSAPFIVFSLLFVYSKKIIKCLDFKNLIIFLILIFSFGGFWYLRNFLLTGNPFYPQAFLFFPGLKSTILDTSILHILIGPLIGLIGTVNAFISEYMIWSFIIPVVIIYFFSKEKKNKWRLFPVRLFLISFMTSIFVINLPSSYETSIMTSSMRYLLIVVIPLILFSFVYLSRIGRQRLLFIATLVSIFYVGFPLGFSPKLLVVAVPFCVAIYYKGYMVVEFILKRYFKS